MNRLSRGFGIRLIDLGKIFLHSSMAAFKKHNRKVERIVL